jgi:16S rRNA (adenine1518-N6/adenine1519-N6)-dimethyltransferase
MNLSQISATLREIKVAPVKSLGQNFMHDQNLARWIVDQADLTTSDCVVEVGPGLGALTTFALAKGAHVLAIEKDARLAKFLSEEFAGKNCEIVHADALDFDVRALFTKPRVKFLGNLPYYVASQLLLKFVKWPSPISLWLCMLQNEMARRLSAAPGRKDYGALTLQIQLHYRVEYLRSVSAAVFIPRPEIDSAIVRLVPRHPTELPACDDVLFGQLVRRGFSQRRKQLGKLLREEIADWPAAASTLGVDSKVRGEELTLEQWIALTNYVRPIPLEDATATAEECFPVVDEMDRLVGAAPRSEVHGDNLRHRAVHILIFARNGDLLLQKRSPWKDRHPLVWDSSAAGHVNAGEEYDFAAARELEEELGIRTPLTRVLKIPASDRTGQEFIWLYAGQSQGPFRLNRAEIEAGEFFPPAIIQGWIEARPNDFAPGFVWCWAAYRKQQTD